MTPIRKTAMLRYAKAPLCLLPLLAAPACSSIGFGAQRSVEAAGVAATSAVATPVIGFASWPLWHWGGSVTSEWLSGTEEVRIPLAAPPAPSAPNFTGRPLTPQPMNFDLNFLLLIGVIVAIWWLDKRVDRLEK